MPTPEEIKKIAKEHYVSYECAVKLKEMGFDWEVRGYYTRDDNFQKVWEVTSLNHNDTKKFKNILSAPRLDQAAAWIRDCKGIDIEVTTVLRNPTKKSKYYMSNISYFSKDIDGNDCGNYVRAGIDIHSYEKALEIGINKALKLLGDNTQRSKQYE